MRFLTVMWPLRHLILFTAWSNFRSESQRMYLGVVWWILDPLLQMFVYYMAFGVLLNRGGSDFLAILITGITAWQLFTRIVQSSSTSISRGKSIIQKSPIPRCFLPLAAVVEGLIESLFRFSAMFAMLLLFSVHPNIHWTGLIPVFVVQVFLICGVALPLASIVPFVPDLSKFISYTLRLMFFLSGVFYRIDRLSPEVQPYVRLNPMAFIIECYRDVLLYETWPDWQGMLIVLGSGIVGAMLGLWAIDRMGAAYAKRTAN